MSWRYLKRNHSNSSVTNIIFFDTETTDSVKQEDSRSSTLSFRLGCAISGRLENQQMTRRKTLEFSDTAVFWQWAFSHGSPRRTTMIVAHNAIFDLTICEFWRLWENNLVTIDAPRSKKVRHSPDPDKSHSRGICVLENPPTIIGFRHIATQSRFILVDSMNWFPLKLAELGKQCGIDKLPMPNRLADDSAWFQYCMRDVEILEKSITNYIQWVKTNDLGIFRYTAAAQAMSAFRHSRMEHVPCFHDESDVKKLERAAFYGGRTECFRIGEISENVHQLDITSLYPSVMRCNQYPIKLKRWEIRDEYLELAPILSPARSVAEVELSTGNAVFPLRRGYHVCYAKGNFTTTLAGRDLLRAVKSGSIKSWRSWAEYKTAPLFDYYVNSLWKLRKQYRADGNKVYESYVKTLLNSLYGKFGQRSPKWESRPDIIPPEPFSRWTVNPSPFDDVQYYRSVGWHTQQMTGRGEHSKSFPAVCAFVTSYAREVMDRIRNIAGIGNVFYQGVDSVLVNDDGLNNLDRHGLINPFKLGYLRLQESAARCNIAGCGEYEIGDKITHSGRTSAAEHIQPGVWIDEQWSGVDALFDGASRKTVDIVPVVKTYNGSYRKGNIGADGWTEPLNIS